MSNSTCNIDIKLQPCVDCQRTSYATAATGPKRKAVWNNDLKQQYLCLLAQCHPTIAAAVFVCAYQSQSLHLHKPGLSSLCLISPLSPCP